MVTSSLCTTRFLAFQTVIAFLLVGCGSPAINDSTVTDSLLEEEHAPTAPYSIYVTNERSGDLTVISGDTHELVTTIPLGKRPRGVKIGPNRQYLFVALSGSPPSPPGIDESTLPPPDREADGIGIVDLSINKLVRVLNAGTDPDITVIIK